MTKPTPSHELSRRDSMTPGQRMAALVKGGKPDRVPYVPFAGSFSATVAGIDRGQYYRDPKNAFQAGLKLMEVYPWMNTRPGYGWAERGAWEFGGEIIWPDGNRYPAPVSFDPVITRPEEVEDLPDPDPATAGMMPLVARFNELSRSKGFPASLPGGTPTTLTAGIVGRDTFLKWLLRHPDAVHAVQRKVTDFIIRAAIKTIRTYGAENCTLFSGVPMESNQLISPQMFETFCKPYIKELFDFYADAGVTKVTVHLCGDHTLNAVHWKDVTLPDRTIFSIGHEMDIEDTGGVVGSNHIVAGNMNNAIIQNGTPEEVRAEARRCLESGKRHPGGFVLMPACGFPPDTPLENVEAIAQGLLDCGFYD